MGGVADGETTNEMLGLVGGGGCHWVIGGWCRGQKKTPTSHKVHQENMKLLKFYLILLNPLN